MTRTLTAAALAACTTLTLTSGAARAQSACGEVSITQMDWASSAIVTSVATFLMQQGYDCSVTVVPSSTTPALASVAETGEPDIVTELWTNGTPVYDELAAEGRIVTLTDVLTDGGVQGWYIPTYLAEEYPELTTLQGILDNPDLVGNRLHSCPEGWTCKDTTEALAAAVDAEGNGIEVFKHGSGETLAASMASAYENREPWLGYYWSPTGVLGKYDMTMVDLGPYDEETFFCNADPECESDGVTSYSVAPVKTVVTSTFETDHPELTELLSNIQFTNEQMNDILAWQEENNASPEEAAVWFLTTYSDVWQDWVSDEARVKLAGLIE